MIDKGLTVWSVDASRIAREVGLGGRINTVMQPCFFALSSVIDRETAVRLVKESIEKAYKRRGRTVVERNHAAVDRALLEMHRVEPRTSADSARRMLPAVAAGAPDFVRDVTARMLAGEGDLLPVSALPVDGTFPTGTARWEKRSLADAIPVWDADLCIDCGKCAIVCPHAAIRMKAYPAEDLVGAPEDFLSKTYGGRELPAGTRLTIQVAPDDCTGCGICVDVCPARSKSEVKHKAIDLLARRRPSRGRAGPATTSSSGFPRSIGAPCVTTRSRARDCCSRSSSSRARARAAARQPYVKLLCQQFGDRMVSVANATGCSSIYGGNLPTTPWATDATGRGPAWSRIRSSRTTPSSVWDQARVPMPSGTMPVGCSPSCRTRSVPTWPEPCSTMSLVPRTRRGSCVSGPASPSCERSLAGPGRS